MAIPFHPKKKQILICNFKGYIPPEINESRPVVVLREEVTGSQKLVIVVPLSNTTPVPLCDFHCQLTNSTLTGCMSGKTHWVKGDLIYTVSVDRLDRVKGPPEKGSGKKCSYTVGQVSNEDFAKILECIKSNFDSSSITNETI